MTASRVRVEQFRAMLNEKIGFLTDFQKVCLAQKMEAYIPYPAKEIGAWFAGTSNPPTTIVPAFQKRLEEAMYDLGFV